MSNDTRTWRPRFPAQLRRGRTPPAAEALPAINVHFVILAGLSILCALGLGGWLLVENARAVRAGIEQQAQTLARLSSFSVDREVVAAQTILSTLASSSAHGAGDLETFYAHAVAAPKPGGASVLLVDVT